MSWFSIIGLVANISLAAAGFYLACRARGELRIATQYNVLTTARLRELKPTDVHLLAPYRDPAELPPSSSTPEIIKWCWNYYGTPPGFVCPKCDGKASTNKVPHPIICSCALYPRAHFHFACRDCKFEAIMRTVDDKESP